MKWYIIHTYSGYEGKVKLAMEQRIKDLGLESSFGEILVPQQEVQQRNRETGESTKGQQKLFPGYVIVEMDMNNESWHLVNDTPKVTGFVGASTRPRPVPERQIKALRDKLDSGVAPEKVEIDLEKGHDIKITSGPFANFTGVVDEANHDRQKVRVLISIFGRSTPVDLDFHQVERAT
jgi:transcription termination/antitermination protein NusG